MVAAKQTENSMQRKMLKNVDINDCGVYKDKENLAPNLRKPWEEKENCL